MGTPANAGDTPRSAAAITAELISIPVSATSRDIIAGRERLKTETDQRFPAPIADAVTGLSQRVVFAAIASRQIEAPTVSAFSAFDRAYYMAGARFLAAMSTSLPTNSDSPRSIIGGWEEAYRINAGLSRTFEDAQRARTPSVFSDPQGALTARERIEHLQKSTFNPSSAP